MYNTRHQLRECDAYSLFRLLLFGRMLYRFDTAAHFLRGDQTPEGPKEQEVRVLSVLTHL